MIQINFSHQILRHIYTRSRNKDKGENMQNNNSQIVNVSNTGWFVETRTGFDGPFDTKQEASTFLDLVKCSNAARVEFAGLQYTPE